MTPTPPNLFKHENCNIVLHPQPLFRVKTFWHLFCPKLISELCLEGGRKLLNQLPEVNSITIESLWKSFTTCADDFLGAAVAEIAGESKLIENGEFWSSSQLLERGSLSGAIGLNFNQTYSILSFDWGTIAKLDWVWSELDVRMLHPFVLLQFRVMFNFVCVCFHF